MSGGWRCEGCGAAHPGSVWACHWCGHARERRDSAPLLPPPARSSAATRIVVAVGAVAVGLLVVSIVAMASARKDRAQGPNGSFPGAIPDASATPPGMYAAPADPMLVIDRASAERVLGTYWETRQTALEQSDVALLRSVATGATAEWDGACGCTPTGPPTGDDYFTAPPQTGYPARFLAERKWRQRVTSAEGTTTQEVSDLVVFVRPSAEEPWKAVIHAGVVGGLPFDAVLQDPFAAQLPAVAGPIPPESVPDAVAAYFQSWRDTGAAPVESPVADSGMVHTRGQGIWAFRTKIEKQGGTSATTYRSGLAEDGLYEFWGVGGRLVCGTVRWTGAEQAATAPVEQPSDRSVFPSFVPPGRFTTVAMTGVRQVCVTMGEHVEVQVMAGGDTTAAFVGA